MRAARSRVQLCIEPCAQPRQFISPATRKACKSRRHQLVEAHKCGRGISRKHTHRHTTPLGKTEWPARPHGYVHEVKFSAQSGQDIFHKVAFSCRSSSSRDQQIRAEPCPLEHRREVSMIVWSDAFIARFSAGGKNQRGKHDGIAVSHLAVRRFGGHIHEFVAGTNDCNSRTPECAHGRFAGESQECQFPRVQYFAYRNKFVALTKVFARREHAITWNNRRENFDSGSISLGAFLRNHGIGAEWNGRAGRNGESGSVRENRFAFFSEHLPSHGKLDRVFLCC